MSFLLLLSLGGNTLGCIIFNASNADTVGLNEETIKKYIREQEDADKMTDNVKEPENPFKG